MQYLIIFFIIIIISIVISIKLKIRTEQAIPIVVIGLTIIVYLIGMIGNLLIGIYLIILLCIISLIYLIYYLLKNIKNTKKILKQYITPAIIIYGLMYIIFIKINQNRIFNNYDEFNHWALIIKDIYLNNDFLFEQESITAFGEYPPFTAVFEYIILKFSSVYSEDTIIIANNILSFSLIMPMFKKIRWDRSIKWISILIPIAVILPLIVYEHFYCNILVDGLMGIFIAYILYQWFINDKNKVYRNIATGVGIIGLTLIKSSGIGLALILTIIILFDCIRINRIKKISIKKDIFAILTIFIISILLLSLWQIQIEKNNSLKNWNINNICIENIVEVVKGNEPSGKEGIINNYIEKIFYQQTITERNLTVFTATLVILIINIIIYINIGKEYQKRYLYYSICLYIFEIIYLVYMLFVYLFLLNEGEANGFASFNRYYGTILLASLLFHILMGVEYAKRINTKIIAIILSILIIFSPTKSIQTDIINAKQEKLNRIVERKTYIKILDYKKDLSQDDKVYLIDTSSNNFQHLLQIMKYQMLPIRIDNEVKTNDVNILKEIWKKKKYTHIYIQKIDPKTKNEFEKNFLETIIDKTMYKIIYDDEIKLEKVNINNIQ